MIVGFIATNRWHNIGQDFGSANTEPSSTIAVQLSGSPRQHDHCSTPYLLGHSEHKNTKYLVLIIITIKHYFKWHYTAK